MFALAAVVAFPLQGSRTIEVSASSAASAATLEPVVIYPSVSVASDQRVAGASRGVTAEAFQVESALPQVFTDTSAGVSFVAPAGWVEGPATALNPVSDP